MLRAAVAFSPGGSCYLFTAVLRPDSLYLGLGLLPLYSTLCPVTTLLPFPLPMHVLHRLPMALVRREDTADLMYRFSIYQHISVFLCTSAQTDTKTCGRTGPQSLTATYRSWLMQNPPIQQVHSFCALPAKQYFPELSNLDLKCRPSVFFESVP